MEDNHSNDILNSEFLNTLEQFNIINKTIVEKHIK